MKIAGKLTATICVLGFLVWFGIISMSDLRKSGNLIEYEGAAVLSSDLVCQLALNESRLELDTEEDGTTTYWLKSFSEYPELNRVGVVGESTFYAFTSVGVPLLLIVAGAGCVGYIWFNPWGVEA